MSRYVRLCKSLHDKGTLVTPNEIEVDYNKDSYESVYYYSEEHLKQFKEKGSVKGIKDVTTDKIWFDFDHKDNIELCRQDSLEVIKRLNKYGLTESNIEIYYSGNKGFNVLATLNKELMPEDVYNLCVNKFGKELQTLDTSMYDSVQILRIPGTKHPKSKLHKIPISLNELKNSTIEQIREKAKSLDNVSEFNWEVASPNDTFYAVEVSKKKHETKYELDLTKKPTQWRSCKWSLLQGNFESGQRHEALLVLAATCRGLGYDKETTYYMCKSALKKQAIRTKQDEFPKEELWENIIEESVFKDGWEGGQYTCTKPGWLQNYCRSLGDHSCKDESDSPDKIEVLEVKDLLNLYDDFIKRYDQNRILTGIKSLDDNLNITIGQPVALLAAPSVGKTSLVLNILNNASQQGLHSMFFSLDMYNALITQKLLHKFTNLNFDKLKDLILNDPESAVEYYNQVENNMKNMHTVVKSGITANDMKKVVQDYERDRGVKITIIAVDYLELVSGPFSDETSNSGFNAKALRDLANDLQACVFVLTQPQKVKKPDEPIHSYRDIKGASLLEQSFRIIIGAYRPGFSPDYPEDDRFIGLNCVKNTMGPLFSTHLSFDGLTGNVRELTIEEEEHLKDVIRRKKESQEQSNKQWD